MTDNERQGKDRQFIDVFLTRKDKTFHFANLLLTLCLTLLVLLPLLHVLSASFSSPSAVSLGKVLIFPVDFSLEGYRRVFVYPGIWTSYANTIFYTVAGTAVNVLLTLLAAYPLAKRGLPLRGFIMFLFTFTMLFSGGMIPTYLVVKKIGITNTRWAMLLPGALSVYKTIIARTFMQDIPEELSEAAALDGCDDARYFLRVVLPLSGTLISVLTLFYAVGHWNDYFQAFLYLVDRDKLPLQLILREILVANTINLDSFTDPETAMALAGMADLMKYSLIIVSCAPILVLYPFLQRYFVKGVMIGSLKG